MMELFPSHSIYNEYKTRNILSLADRIQVIRQYESCPTRPSFQSLATKFDCSSKQIKNIILSRDSIVKSYQEAGDNLNEDTRDEVYQKRQEKIDFLGKVMYEYIQRVVYFNYGVDEEKVRQKALQIKECIAIENFQPNNGWFQHFKMRYGLSKFDMESLRNNVHLMEPKRPALSAIDMIQFVSRQEQKARKSNVNGVKRKRGRPSRLEKLQRQGEHMPTEPTVVYETINDDDEGADYNDHGEVNDSHDDDDDDVDVISPKSIPSYNTFHEKAMKDLSNPKPRPPILAMYTQSPTQKRKRSNSPFPDIGSADEALKHVKVLEEYAMLQDNYRAIGLLTQLEDIFKKKTKNT